MKRIIAYSNDPLGDVEVVPDFLPPPAELAFREAAVKVTLALSKRSVDCFKTEASKHQTQYQHIIRRMFDAYVKNGATAWPCVSRRRSPAGHDLRKARR